MNENEKIVLNLKHIPLLDDKNEPAKDKDGMDLWIQDDLFVLNILVNALNSSCIMGNFRDAVMLENIVKEAVKNTSASIEITNSQAKMIKNTLKQIAENPQAKFDMTLIRSFAHFEEQLENIKRTE